MAIMARDYECRVVHHHVQIYSRHQKHERFDTHGSKSYFVQCNQDDCPHVDKNELPCPLNASVFARGACADGDPPQ